MTPVAMDPVLLLLLVGFLYVLVFGGLSFMRREALSAQFAIESVIVIGVLVGGSVLAGISLSPILFLALLYLITMRSRWTVDLGNLLGQRGKYRPALTLYRLALAWWPDRAARLLALANRATVELRTGETQAAIATLQECLEPADRRYMGMRCEATCLYNLAVAYERSGRDAEAVVMYNEVIDLLPGSPQGRAAQAALKRRQGKEPKEAES